jgi:putative flippase GtrA
MSRPVRFALVGLLGYVVDTLVLLLLVGLGGGLYLSRLGSWLTAASTTWLCNRRFTYANSSPARLQQWSRFLAANSIGATVNYACYALLVSNLSLFNQYLPLAVAVGSLAGMLFNYTASSCWVFREKTSTK